MRLKIGLVVFTTSLLLVVGCDRPPVNRDDTIPLTTAPSVDVQRYLGRWYEIARLPNQFETDCTRVTATYALNADKSLSVLNRCHKGVSNGPEDFSKGTAHIVDAQTNAKLSVTFFWPFSGDYWILAVADDYSWSLVGEPSGRYFWILSRTPRISDDLTKNLKQRAKALGYKTGALYWTPQSSNTNATR